MCSHILGVSDSDIKSMTNTQSKPDSVCVVSFSWLSAAHVDISKSVFRWQWQIVMGNLLCQTKYVSEKEFKVSCLTSRFISGKYVVGKKHMQTFVIGKLHKSISTVRTSMTVNDTITNTETSQPESCGIHFVSLNGCTTLPPTGERQSLSHCSLHNEAGTLVFFTPWLDLLVFCHFLVAHWFWVFLLCNFMVKDALSLFSLSLFLPQRQTTPLSLSPSFLPFLSLSIGRLQPLSSEDTCFGSYSSQSDSQYGSPPPRGWSEEMDEYGHTLYVSDYTNEKVPAARGWSSLLCWFLEMHGAGGSSVWL